VPIELQRALPIPSSSISFLSINRRIKEPSGFVRNQLSLRLTENSGIMEETMEEVGGVESSASTQEFAYVILDWTNAEHQPAPTVQNLPVPQGVTIYEVEGMNHMFEVENVLDGEFVLGTRIAAYKGLRGVVLSTTTELRIRGR
jgi:hypothetical protein